MRKDTLNVLVLNDASSACPLSNNLIVPVAASKKSGYSMQEAEEEISFTDT
jgi:hypothetical protein